MEISLTMPVKEATLPAAPLAHDDRHMRPFCVLLLMVALFRCIDPEIFYLHEYLHKEKNLNTIDIVDHGKHRNHRRR